MTKHEHNSNHESDNFATMVREAVAGEALPASDPTLREALLKRLDQPMVEPALKASVADRRRTFFQRAGIALASTAALALVGALWQRPALERVIGLRPAGETLPIVDHFGSRDVTTSKTSGSARPNNGLGSGRGAGARPENEVDTKSYLSRVDGYQKSTQTADDALHGNPGQPEPWGDGVARGGSKVAGEGGAEGVSQGAPQGNVARSYDSPPVATAPVNPSPAPIVTRTPASQPGQPGGPGSLAQYSESSSGSGGIPGRPTGGPRAAEPNSPGVPGKPAQKNLGQLEKSEESLTRQVDRLQTFPESKPVDSASTTSPAQGPVAGESKNELREVAETRYLLSKIDKEEPKTRERREDEVLDKRAKDLSDLAQRNQQEFLFRQQLQEQIGAEQYAKIVENQFLSPLIVGQEKSTFAIDVDTASYANVRRFLTNGQLPPPDAVRLEEMVNYFKYKYPQPKGDDPFSVNTEMADCPWQPGHKLLRVGVQGKEIHRAERPASNIVFLIDTSGSMTDQNKLPLLKQAFTMLVGELNENDKVTIVTYAGNAGLRLPPTRGHEKETIIAAIEGMQSGGSTHGSAGISLAYEVAAAQFIKGGTNKVILATDGDLNVGITDDSQLVDLITKKAKSGVYLTVLGVGTGNLKDAKMERLADNGNGVYAYLDTVKEARKVLVEEMSGSLVTIAKDVKIQLEFNPNYVHSYRLLGYENRVMANKDFENDAKDAGEIGAGHSVTAMYEVVLVGADKNQPEVKADPKTATEPTEEPLRYQRRPDPEKTTLTEAGKGEELLMVKLRYKTPEAKEEDKAKQLNFPVTDKGGSFNSASKEFQFASSVVAFGLTLRQSEYRGSANYSAVAEIASSTLGDDVGGHRAEFVELVKRAKTLRGE